MSQASLRETQVAERIEPLLRKRLPYSDRESSISIDVLVYDSENRSLNAYNVKRGNGAYDGGKRRTIQKELLRTQMLLTDYGRGLGFAPENCDAHVVFYYGLLSLPAPFALSGEELDDHFCFPVREAMEYVNTYFADQLRKLIEQEE